MEPLASATGYVYGYRLSKPTHLWHLGRGCECVGHPEMLRKRTCSIDAPGWIYSLFCSSLTHP